MEPLDVDAPARRRKTYPIVAARRGTVVEHRATRIVGAIVEFAPPRLVLRDANGKDHTLRYDDGCVLADVDGRGAAVALRIPSADPQAAARTASGSIDVGPVPARVARASRIWVEGVHDAELIEKVWGDDLRVEGVVVERLDGADDLAERVRGFRTGPNRRLGVLLDHLVEGSKESRLAAEIDDPDVLITGHPFVDVWQAIKPAVAGIDRWPDVPPPTPWKEGVMTALGAAGTTGEYWRQLLGRVTSWTDLEPELLGAVEQLIDFVAPPER